MLVDSMAVFAPASKSPFTWCKEHPPMGGGIEAASTSSGQMCAWDLREGSNQTN